MSEIATTIYTTQLWTVKMLADIRTETRCLDLRATCSDRDLSSGSAGARSDA